MSRRVLRVLQLLGPLLLAGCPVLSPPVTLEAPPPAASTAPAPADDSQRSPGACSPGGWCWEAPLPQGNALFALAVLPSGERWAVGEGGVVLHGVGSGWERESLGLGARFVGVWAASPAQVWAVGPAGVQRRVDGAWLKTPELGRSLRGVTGFSERDVWAVGDHGGLFHWDGSAWSDRSLGVRGWRAVWGASPSEVWFAGEGGALARWDGVAVQAVEAPLAVELEALWGSSANDAWAAGAAGTLLHWDGARWTAMAPVTGERLTSVWGATSSDVWAVGSAGVVLHCDGAAWAVAPSPTTLGLHAVGGSGATDAWAVGRGGELLHLTGGAWQRTSALPPRRLLGAYDTPRGLFAVGEGGALWWRADGGWVEQASGVTADLHVAYSPDGDDLWAAGDGVLLRFGAFAHVDLGNDDLVTTVTGSSASDVWALGQGLHHFDGGVWVNVAVPAGVKQLLAASAVSPSDAWVVGVTTQNVGGFSHWDGQAWSLPQAVSFAQVRDVWASADGGWAVGDGVWRRDGLAWSLDHSLPSGALWSVTGVSGQAAWAVGAGGRVERWDGVAWTVEDAGTTALLRGVWASGPGDVWVVGSEGVVRHFDGASWQALDAGQGGQSWGSVTGAAPDDVTLASDALAVHWDGSRFVPIPGPLHVGGQVWATAADELYATGITGLWRRRPTWTPQPIEGVWQPSTRPDGSLPADFRALWGSRDGLWAAATDWVLHGAPDGWRAMPTQGLTNRGLWGQAPNDFWVVDDQGLVHSDGATFGAIERPTPHPLEAVWGIDGEWWAVGAQGNAAHRVDGEWHAESTGTSEHLRTVWGFSRTDVWAAGDEGALVHWNGARWFRVESGASVTLRHLAGSSPDRLTAVGDDGAVLRFVPARVQP